MTDRYRRRRLPNTKTKNQTPEKLQGPSSDVGTWKLEFGDSLVFGFWCLVFRPGGVGTENVY
jgi:hypothetical protein